MPCAAGPSFLFSSPSHLFPNPVFLLVFPLRNRTGEKELITNTKQVQNWLHQQVHGAEVTGPTPSFCSPCLPPLTSAQQSVGGTGLRYLAAGKRVKSEESWPERAQVERLRSEFIGVGEFAEEKEAMPEKPLLLMGDSATSRYVSVLK